MENNYIELANNIIKKYEELYTNIDNLWKYDTTTLVKVLCKDKKIQEIKFLLNNYNYIYNTFDNIAKYATLNNINEIVFLLRDYHYGNYQIIAEAAAYNYNKKILEYAIETGKINNNIELLLIAAKNNNLKELKYIAKLTKVNIDDYINDISYISSKYNSEDILKYCLERGANNYQDIANNAAYNNKLELYSNDLNFNEIAAHAANGGNLDIIIKLKDKITSYCDVTIYSALSGNMEILLYAIEMGANNYKSIAYNAAKGGNFYIFKYIMSYTNKLNYNKVALYSVKSGNMDILKISLEEGANNYGKLLLKSCKYNRIDIIKYLIQNYSNNFNIVAYGAALYGNLNVLIYSIDKCSNIKNILKIAIQYKHNNITTYILYNYINAIDKYKCVYYAIKFKNKYVLDRLIALGFNDYAYINEFSNKISTL